MSNGASSEAWIVAENLHRGYSVGKKRVEVLHGINLEIRRGEKVFLCGPSGAGKTTLMYILAGLERPEQGRVLVDGVDLYAQTRRKQAKLRNQCMSYIFQNYYLMPELTALENVMVPAMIGGKDLAEKAKASLERVGLSNRIDHLPAELSGGEQQRVAIARSLVNSPQIIFADEPTGNLDSRNGSQVMEMLINLTKEDNVTLVVVTHDESLALHGDRKMIVKDGVIA
ncbi:ABC transporter ATP-binding protein [Verrucomicrobiaceae bacterium R5-34]|uniref:ABC transporter ATP-binding protein n=1 Tax=Oceaniferula flava TaxID=2800421 RepID=A0AAE2VAT8_9BACT|nr:ABC transporter ATP-binding protein [Oceaniferula flavus]MBK1829496.1 ABC transporter ATP-binding protein [Verrucomicrobiaceae bacterium R5-34]MBK1853725.1 ABC transporter ATP-binding protein [Oceaniferula flavus]MBM1135031.1 ABC transporter ATP-binding protein [Oceaniferula flavus]